MKASVPEHVRQKAETRAAELRGEIDGLQPLRQALNQTQVALAEKMKISQASVAKLEQRTDVLLSTLRQYVQGLGGELSIVVRFPGRPEVRIGGLGDIPVDPTTPKNNKKKGAPLPI